MTKKKNNFKNPSQKLLEAYSASDKIIFYFSALSIINILVQLTIFGLKFQTLPSQIPLFYSLPWGDTQLASISQFMILPFITLLFILTNIIASWHLHDLQIILKRILAAYTLVTTTLITITAIGIISIFG